jgi:hypothetical protein
MRGPIRILQHNSIPGDLPPIFNDRKSLKNLCLKAASAEHLINAEDPIGEAVYRCSLEDPDLKHITPGTAYMIALSAQTLAFEKSGISRECCADTVKRILVYFGYPVKIDLSAAKIADKITCRENILLHCMFSPGSHRDVEISKDELISFLDSGLEKRSGPYI